MARRFAKVLELEIKTAFFYPSDLVNTKTTIPLRVGLQFLLKIISNLFRARASSQDLNRGSQIIGSPNAAKPRAKLWGILWS